jgi:hypothetical protein
MSELSAAIISEGLEVWALLGMGLSPKEVSAKMTAAWLVSLEGIDTTVDEWQWARGYVTTEPGRRFWPSVQEVLDLIRERRRRRLDEMVGIGVERDGKTAVEWKHPSELPSPQVDNGPRVALPDLSRLGSKVVRS